MEGFLSVAVIWTLPEPAKALAELPTYQENDSVNFPFFCEFPTLLHFVLFLKDSVFD